MAFCIQCGKENKDTSKFCVGCGGSLQNNNSMSITKPAVDSNEVRPKNRKILYWALAIIATLGGIGLLINSLSNNKKESVTFSDQKSNNNLSIPSNDEQKKIDLQDENNDIKQKITNYFQATKEKNFEEIYSHLQYCKRYYDTYNPTRESIYNNCTNYWNKATDMELSITNISINKIVNNNYKDCWVTLNYSYFSITDQIRKAINSLKIKISLDNNNSIIEIYEISRN